MKTISLYLTLFCLLSIIFVNAKTGHQEPTGNEKKGSSISGRITIQGKPAAGIKLNLRPMQDDISDRIVGTGITDKDGRYRFTDLKSSYYWLQITSEEYVNANGIDPDMTDEKAGRRILAREGETVIDGDLDLALGGIISGRIVDVDGKPVSDEYVQISEPVQYQDEFEPRFYTNVKTDRNGLYTIKGIPAGRYAISMGVNIAKATGKEKDEIGFGPDGRVGGNRYFEETFYPGVATRDKAVLVEVSLGKESKNINFKPLGRAKIAYTASGQVIDAVSGYPVKSCELWTGYRFSGGSRAVGKLEKTDENGHFRIDGLLPGQFYVSAYLREDANLYSEVVTYEIKDGDISDLKIHIYPGLTLRGRMIIEGEPNPSAVAKLSQLKVATVSTQEGVQQASSQKEVAVESDGSFAVGGLLPEKIKISLGISEADDAFSIVRIENPNGLPVQKVDADQVASVFNPYLITIDKDLTDVRIILRHKNLATLRGRVIITGGNLPANLRLMALIYATSEKGGSSGWRHVDANGNFSMTNLEPGEYKVQLGDGSNRFGDARVVKVSGDGDAVVSLELDLKTLNKRN